LVAEELMNDEELCTSVELLAAALFPATAGATMPIFTDGPAIQLRALLPG
jgi:hypothetical protein